MALFVCVRDNEVAVSTNDIIIKLVATTLKVSGIFTHTECERIGSGKCSQYQNGITLHVCMYACEGEGAGVHILCLCGHVCVAH